MLPRTSRARGAVVAQAVAEPQHELRAGRDGVVVEEGVARRRGRAAETTDEPLLPLHLSVLLV
eukprot:6177636-Pleurochrysis_carterae.AAC.5